MAQTHYAKPVLPFSLVAFDLDGTVLDTVKRTISIRVQDALKATRRHGAQTAVVSGRPFHMLGDTLLTASWVDWLVTTNGALIINAHTRKHVFESAMPRELLWSIFSDLADLEPAWMACSEFTSYREKRGITYLAGASGSTLNTNNLKQIMEVLSDVNFVDSLSSSLEKISVPIYKMGVSFPDHTRAIEATKRLQARGDLEVFIMSPFELEITVRGVDKGTAIEHLCKNSNLDISRSVAFGDSGNDISMSGHAGTFVAMANGDKLIRAAADCICPSITQDGVAVWLEDRMC